MCVRVRAVTTEIVPWDRTRNTINIPAGLTVGRQLDAVRFLLARMGTPQPAGRAVCHCGDPVLLGEEARTAWVPAQRQSEDEVMSRGA